MKQINETIQIKCIFLYLLVFLFLLSNLSIVFAQEDTNIQILVPSNFYSGDPLSFTYNITGYIDSQLIIKSGIECLYLHVPSSGYQTLELKFGEGFFGYYDSAFVISEEIEPQTCTAYVQILSPVQQTFSKNFSIATQPSFNFEIEMSKKVFIKGEDIYLSYSSSVANPSINAILTYPDKTTRQITLPTTIKAEQVGTYTLDVNASKEGYKESDLKELFGVIETESNVTYQNVSSTVPSTTLVHKNYLMYGLLGLLCLVFVFIIWYLITHFKRKEVSGQESLGEETQIQKG
jgi:hypothetical protein